MLRFYCPVNPMGSYRARSVYLTTRLLGRLSPLKQLTSIVHILSPETDKCPSWISGRERMTVENISWSISTKECCRPRRGLNPRPPGLQSDGASEPPRPAHISSTVPPRITSFEVWLYLLKVMRRVPKGPFDSHIHLWPDLLYTRFLFFFFSGAYLMYWFG